MFFNRSRKWIVKPDSLAADFKKPGPYIHRAGNNNYSEWMDAITGKIEQSESHFAQSGPLTETVLLGVLAQLIPDTVLKWDSANLEVAGRVDLKKYIQREYRDGWQAV